MNKEQRKQSLLPGGIPKWVRIYDNGGKTVDRYVCIYTGNYRHIPNRVTTPKHGPEEFQSVCMSECPFHPQGVGMHCSSQERIDVNRWGFAPMVGRKNHLGIRIRFQDLPKDCRTLVLRDYKEIWGL